MPMWNPWRGCKKCSEGCLHCYIHKGDAKHGVDTSMIVNSNSSLNSCFVKFMAPLSKFLACVPKELRIASNCSFSVIFAIYYFFIKNLFTFRYLQIQTILRQSH